MSQNKFTSNRNDKYNKPLSTKEDNGIIVEGNIVDIGGGGNYTVNIEGMDLIVIAYAGGKLKKNNIKLMKGDKVQVKLNEYDPKKGIITFRLK